ncbi:MAG TPA: RIP metalloprotease RseP [Cyclobacteriaceae bacterium]
MTAQLLLSLSILIVVHEWGHFISARMFKIKVEKFYLFFDFLFPLANVLNFSLIKYKKGDTEYGVGWFPLGGYVKIAGMVDESMDKEQMNAPAQPWEFRSKPAWQRLIVMLGGIIVNVIVGITIFVCITYFLGDEYIPKQYTVTHGGIEALQFGKKIGLQTGDQIIKINGQDFEEFGDITDPDKLMAKDANYTVIRNGQEISVPIPGNFIENFNKKESALRVVRPRIEAIIGDIPEKMEVRKGEEVEEVVPLSKKLGLKVGDRVTEVDGHPVTYYDELLGFMEKYKRDTVDMTRNNDSISFKVMRGSEVMSYHEPLVAGMIGFTPVGIPDSLLIHTRYSFAQAIPLGAGRAFKIIFVQLKAFGKIARNEISLKNSLSGPVGMAQAYGKTWDWRRFWHLTGLLSMVLAFMNLLPIPALDGGYVVFLLYEMVSGRAPSEKFFEASLKVGMFLLLVLMVFVFYNDIAKFFA